MYVVTATDESFEKFGDTATLILSVAGSVSGSCQLRAPSVEWNRPSNAAKNNAG